MGNWFLDRMAPNTPQAPTPTRPVPSAIPVQVPPSTRANYPAQTQTQAQEETYRPSKPLASNEAGVCPECRSGNYMPFRDPRGNTLNRCYDCGYPVIQQGSGMSIQGASEVSGPVTPSRQVASAKFNPSKIEIIGRIG